MRKGTVLILGARSDIARAIAHSFAKDGYDLQLAARSVDRLQHDQSNLALRYNVSVTLYEFDALATDTHAAFVKDLPALPDIVVCAVGYLGSQAESGHDGKTASLVMQTNYVGSANILGEFANHFEARRYGILVGISSVAGERGRSTNYVYGSAKAGFTAYLSGLRNRLFRKGVHVVTVLPGFVDTQMTEGMDLPSILTAQPSEVAEAVRRAVSKKSDVVYVRPVWRLIMAVIRMMPERLFKRLTL